MHVANECMFAWMHMNASCNCPGGSFTMKVVGHDVHSAAEAKALEEEADRDISQMMDDFPVLKERIYMWRGVQASG
jgi:hypothetical protein